MTGEWGLVCKGTLKWDQLNVGGGDFKIKMEKVFWTIIQNKDSHTQELFKSESGDHLNAGYENHGCKMHPRPRKRVFCVC